jgi:hypothetical protein
MAIARIDSLAEFYPEIAEEGGGAANNRQKKRPVKGRF